MQVGTALLCGMVGIMIPLLIAMFVFATIRSGCCDVCSDAYDTDDTDDTEAPNDSPDTSLDDDTLNVSKRRTWIVVESPDTSLSAAMKV